jgi:hypothetical protein
MKVMDCEMVAEQASAYIAKTLNKADAKALTAHLEECESCRASVQRFRAVEGLLEYVQIDPQQPQQQVREEEEELEEVGAASSDSVFTRMGGAPWWAVSCALHILVIALASLVSMSIELPKTDDSVIMVTELAPRVALPQEQEPPKTDRVEALAQRDTPATDPNAPNASDIVVPPDILAKAELGDHFETINPELPDTHSALGNPDSKSFHSVEGNTEPPGGGGMGGLGMDDLIGVGGAPSKGTGGGFGGGDGTGVGVGTGAGKGSFGNRNGGGRKLMVMRHGGSKASEGAVDKALEWLAYHQEADGHWDCLKWEGSANDGRCVGINGNAATTGFALIAFLGAGHTDKVGKYRDNVARGLKWLIEQLNECEKTCGKGRWCVNYGSNYTQGVATMALAEASGMNPRNAELKDAAQRAVDGVIFGQIKVADSEYHAWGYAPHATTNDTSVSGWNVMALKSAKCAGLHVDPFSFSGAMAWINTGQDLKDAPKGGDAEYWEGGMMAYQGTVGAAPGTHKNMAMTAAAALTRLLVGGEKPDSAGVAGPCNLMKQEAHLPNKWPGNLYYWYYATLCMFQKGGEHWKSWNEPMKKTLVDCQRKDGDFAGSYDPLDGEDLGHIRGGRVQATALGALCLEVYYRYQKLSN